MMLLKSNKARRIVNGLSHYSRSKNQPNNQFPGITCSIIALLFYHIKIIMKILFFLFGLLLYSVELSAALLALSLKPKLLSIKFSQNTIKRCIATVILTQNIRLIWIHVIWAVHLIKKRSHIVEIEHLVTVDVLGHNLVCWTSQICEQRGTHYKARKCCEKSDCHFRQMESELYNLWPAVGLVNVARSNYSYAKIDSTDGFYGCDFKINKASKEVEPANKVKGIAARATLFMSDKYHIPLSENKRQLYLSWNKSFLPVKMGKRIGTEGGKYWGFIY